MPTFVIVSALILVNIYLIVLIFVPDDVHHPEDSYSIPLEIITFIFFDILLILCLLSQYGIINLPPDAFAGDNGTDMNFQSV